MAPKNWKLPLDFSSEDILDLKRNGKSYGDLVKMFGRMGVIVTRQAIMYHVKRGRCREKEAVGAHD
uniref:Uncharacterized protein n=1 Tax=viral metagenome TaxID=1070528 RepID=A0A6M3XYV5_9ZZZZ